MALFGVLENLMYLFDEQSVALLFRGLIRSIRNVRYPRNTLIMSMMNDIERTCNGASWRQPAKLLGDVA